MLLTLQQIGNVKYTGWTLSVPCTTDKQVIIELQQQAKTMEKELQLWKETVRCRRQEFYELNYFNTMQLLNLRKELGKVKMSDGSHEVSPDVLALLQSISSRVTPQIVSNAISEVRTNGSVAESSEDAEHLDHVEHPEMEEELPTLTDNVTIPQLPEEQPPNYNIDWPKSTESDLSVVQKEIVATITSRLSCSRQLVIKSFEECTNGNDRYDYEEWCSENASMDLFLEVYEDDSDMSDNNDAASSNSEDSVVQQHPFSHSTCR